MRNRNQTFGPWTTPSINGAAIAAVLSLSVACDLDPGEDEGEGDGSGMSASASESESESESMGSSGEVPGTTGMSGTGGSDGGSHTSVDPTAGSDEGGETMGEESGGEETGGTGDPGDPCEALAVTCATFDSGELILFQLDTGSIEDSISFPVETFETHSIAWVGDDVYVCAGEPQTLYEVDVPTAAVTNSGLECTGVADVQGALLVRRGTLGGFSADYAYYDDFGDVLAGLPSEVTEYPPSIDRITATDDTLISTWHSDDHFSTYELATAAPLGDVNLDGYDGWNMGMDVVAGQLVISTWFSDPLRHIAFDLATGVRTCELPSVGGSLDFVSGLACQVDDVAPPAPPAG